MKSFPLILVAVLFFGGYAVYFRCLFKTDFKPNVLSWGAWSFSSLVTFYVFMSTSEEMTYLINVSIDVLLCSFVAVFALKRGVIKSLPLYQKVSTGISVTALVLMVFFSGVVAPEVPVTLSMVSGISVMPVLVSSWKGETNEPVAAWLLWTLSLGISAAMAATAGVTYLNLGLPLLAALMHGLVGVAAAVGAVKNTACRSVMLFG